MIAVAILAAGQGLRFGRGDLPKQFALIAGKPVFVYSVELYRRVESMGPLILVTNPNFVDKTIEMLTQFDCADDLTIVAGGNTRRASIRNAISWLTDNSSMSGDDRLVLHNAASPNTSELLVRRCIDMARDADAVQAYTPELRTVFEVAAGTVGSVLRRDRHAVSCDPTIYKMSVLREALNHEQRLDIPGDATTDIVNELGYSIQLVQSEYDNIKITTRWDLAAAKEAMVQTKQ